MISLYGILRTRGKGRFDIFKDLRFQLLRRDLAMWPPLGLQTPMASLGNLGLKASLAWMARGSVPFSLSYNGPSPDGQKASEFVSRPTSSEHPSEGHSPPPQCSATRSVLF